MTITVYKVRIYNVQTDEFQISRRLATKAGAKMMGGDIVDGSDTDIDESRLEPGTQWTARGFDPNANVGFQQQVRS
jgi:hypothetical protein